MARPITQRVEYAADADRVHDVLVDRDYLAARLAELGGRDAALVTHDLDGTRATIGLRQGVPVEFLPAMVRRFTGDDLVLDRVERWRPRDAGGWAADIEVTVRGLPGTVTGGQELTGSGAGSVLDLRGSASIPMPLIGGRVEASVVEGVGVLLGFEADFTRRWLAR